MGTPAGHLGQFSVGNLLDQRMCEDVRHLRTVHILDHKSGRTKALHGLQEDLVGPLTYLPQDDVRHGSAADCDQVEDAALGCIQMLQASQYEISDIRGQGGHQIGTKRPALTTLMELISINEGTDERFDEQRRTTGAGAQEREQFGRPIAAFQLGQEMLADMALETDAARMLVWRAGYLKDTGKPSTTETSVAKLYATEAAIKCANTAIQVHGGSGYVDDYPVERYFRDVRVTSLYEGTSQIQKLIIGRALTGVNALIPQ